MIKEEMIKNLLDHIAVLYNVRKANKERNEVLENAILLAEMGLTALGCLNYKDLDTSTTQK